MLARMEPKKYQTTIGIVVLLALIGGGYLFTRQNQGLPLILSPATLPAATSTAQAGMTTTTTASGTVSVTSTGGGYTIKEVSVGRESPALKAPDYNAPIVFPASSNLTAEQKSAIEAQAAAMRAQLSRNSAEYTPWLVLGGFFKQAEDYTQAEEIWTYVSLRWPDDGTVLGNLGDLYLTYLKDYPKAEASYLGAIKNDPGQVNAYRNLFTLYSTVYTPRNSAAADILKEGIRNNPETLDFYTSLARYYRDNGRTEEARAAYDVAIAQAKRLATASNFGAANDLEAEKAALK